MNVKIVSGGTGRSTKVYAGDTEIKGVYSVEIDKIEPDSFVGATIKIRAVDLDITLPSERGATDD